MTGNQATTRAHWALDKRSRMSDWVARLFGVAMVFVSIQAFAGQFLRGVNVSQWFEAGRIVALTDSELRAIKAAGFDHLRIPVDPVALGWNPKNTSSRLSGTPRLLSAVHQVQAAGLDVVVDMHPDAATKQAIEDEQEWADAYVRMWVRLAAEFKQVPAEYVAFELLNEPQYYGLLGAFEWARYQKRLVAAVRQELPRHTLIVSGRRGGGFEGLVELEPLGDANLIYSFHYYYPLIFTHQGASWMRDEWSSARHWFDVRYPAVHALKSLPHLKGRQAVKSAKKELQDYLQTGWNRPRIEAHLQPLLAWARTYRVRVYCGEFGVIRQDVDPASRYRWIADVRSLAQDQGWGWAPWNYSGDFGLTTLSNTGGGERGTLEPAALRALGLRAPRE